MGYNLLINGVYWGYNPLILTIDPNFQRDIQGGILISSSANSLANSFFLVLREWGNESPFP